MIGMIAEFYDLIQEEADNFRMKLVQIVKEHQIPPTGLDCKSKKLRTSFIEQTRNELNF
jgi:hypothetical protein